MTSADDPDNLTAWQSADHASCTRHRKYALDCDQFDGLLERSKGRCELCGLEGSASAWGLLHIDHEHQVGRWAVRGLLCDGCNVRLQRGRRLPDTPPLRRYLANAWYRLELERLGIGGEIPEEPSLGSIVRTGSRSWIRVDTEIDKCWGSRHGKVHCTIRSWREIWYEQGPFHFRLIQERDSISKWDLGFYGSAIRLAAYIKKSRAADPSVDLYTGFRRNRDDTRRPESRTPAKD
jgi:hypothetical protein